MLNELINYEFKNKNIIDEIMNLNDNLVLLGDTFISNYISNKIMIEFAVYDNDIKYYYDIESLNNLKVKLSSNDYLSERIIKLHIDEISDKNDKFGDLFKALIGGYILDNNEINYSIIDRLLNTDEAILLGIDNGLNYYKLVYDWSKNKYKELPVFEISSSDNKYVTNIKLKDISEEFTGIARSKYLSLLMASKNAYDYLNNNSMLLKMSDIVGLPDLDKCINQLQELYVKGFINEPQYKIAMKGSSNGIDVWKCRILIDGYKESFSSEDTSKKNAKRNCAFEMLKYIMEEK